MPRSGPSGTATPPPGLVPKNPGDIIPSAGWTNGFTDIYSIFNTATPVDYGGTGASTAIGAHDAITTKGVDVSTAATLNLDTVTGSFIDLTGTTTVTAVTLAEGKQRITRAAGDFQVTVGASLIGNGGANALIRSGDLIFWEGYAGSVVRFWIVGTGRSSATLVDVRRNRLVDHDMRVSQENGTTSGTTNGYYPVDQWAQFRVTSAGVLTVAQVASVTPAGSPNRLRATVTTADASLAAGEYWTISQNLEGSNVADFKYGAAGAFNSVLRFGFKGPAGTYAVHLGNSAANRSYVALFTITAPQANTDTVQTISIAGDVTGTWLTADGVIGITLDIVLAAGTTFQGALGWQAGNILATSAISNGMGTGSAVFELFDVGLRLDPDATGVYGQYEVGEVHPVWRSERYIWKLSGNEPFSGSAQFITTNTLIWVIPHDAMAKVTALLSSSTVVHSAANGTFFAVSSITLGAGGVLATRLNLTSSQSGFTAGTMSTLGGGAPTSFVLLSARL